MILFSLILGLMFASDPVLITGSVFNEAGQPLPGVHVYPEGTSIGTTTDIAGRFELRVSSTSSNNIIFSMVGYRRHTETLEMEAGGEYELFIIMQPITLHSGDVIVTAGRRAQVAGSVPLSFTMVTAAELEARNILSLDESLRYIPGVQMAQDQVNIRGASGYSYGTGSRVLLLVDGVPMMGPDQNDIKFDALPLPQVERIEVIKGPGSALYGSGALGGVINLITKGFPEKPETMIRGFNGFYEPVSHGRWKEQWDDAGSWRGYHGVVFTHAMQITPRLGFWVSGTYRDDSGYLENSARRSFQGYSKIGFRPSDNTNLDLYLGYRHNDSRQFLYWNGLNDPLRSGRIIIFGTVASGTNHVLTEHYSFLPSFRHFVNPRLYYTIRGRLYAINVKPLDPRGNVRPKEKHTTGARYGVEAEVTWIPFERGSLISGFTFDDIAAKSEFFIGADSTMLRNQPEYAFFTQLDVEPVPNVTASLGLRYDVYHIDTRDVATKLSPKINLAMSPNESFTLRVAYGHGFRVPSVAERFVNNRDFLPLEPNLELRPEESIGYELGSNFYFRAGNLYSFDLDIALFWNEYKGLVEPKFVPDLGAFQFINLTEASVRGIETALNTYSLDGRHSLRLGFTWLNHKDYTTDAPLVFRSDYQFITALQTKLPYGFNLGVDYRYYSKPSRLDSDFSRFVPDADAFTDIHVVDARVSRNLLLYQDRVNLTFTLAANNIFRRYYVERPAYLAETRNYMFSLQVSF